jgi:hypothetical protein
MAAGFSAMSGDQLMRILLIGWTFMSFSARHSWVRGSSCSRRPNIDKPGSAAFGRCLNCASLACMGCHIRLYGNVVPNIRPCHRARYSTLAQWSAALLEVSCIATGFMVSYMYGCFKALARGFPVVSIVGFVMVLFLYLLAAVQNYVIASTGAGLVGCAN